MIQSITVTNHLGESLKMELGFPEKSGFLIQSIEGLGPPKANINSIELAGIDGSMFNSSRVNSRNIIFTIRFLENSTIEDTRQNSYKYFPIKKNVTLLFETDNRLCKILGYVEANEPNIFSKEESTQISIICPDPYFYSAFKNTSVFSGIEPLMEFPFENESLRDNLLEVSNVKNETSQVIYYDGDSEVGCLIKIKLVGPVGDIIIYNTTLRQSMTINTSKIVQILDSDLVFGDEFLISTNKGNKYLYLLRNGVYTSILNALDKTSDWFQLAKGNNVFAYTTPSGINNLEFTIEYYMIYEGI